MRAALALVLWAAALVASAAPASFFIETELTPARLYVGAETVLKVRLLRAPGVPYGVLRPPVLGDAAELWSLGPVRWFQQPRNGVAWDVHERAYLIVPRRAGTLVVPETEIEGPLRRYALGRDARAASASGPLHSPQLRIDVRPAPAAAAEPWLPARRLTLEESWSQDPSRLAAGSAVTRTLILRADGLPAQRLPQLEMAAHPALRVHHDQPERSTEQHESGTIGRVIQRIVLVPLDEGEVLLPALSVRWWDVVADAPREARLPAKTLRLQAAKAPPASPDAGPFVPATIARAMAIATILLLFALLGSRAYHEPLRDARSLLREACLSGDARAARAALIQWWTARSKGAPPPLLRQLGVHWSPAARAQLTALDAAVYGRHSWDGAEFWRRVRPWLRMSGRPRAAAAPTGKTFFRLQGMD